jgi:hypothetical protein
MWYCTEKMNPLPLSNKIKIIYILYFKSSLDRNRKYYCAVSEWKIQNQKMKGRKNDSRPFFV